MQGTLAATVRDHVTIHTYTSPESGLEVNTHIIELAQQLLVLDTQYGAPFAAEAAEFAASLGKPITRVYISHDHPDHWFGAGAFKRSGIRPRCDPRHDRRRREANAREQPGCRR